MKWKLSIILILCFSSLFSQSKEEKEGDKYFELQDFEKAKNWYKQVYSKEPDNKSINEKLCLAYLELSQGNNALEHINKALTNEANKTQNNFYLKAKSLQLVHQFDSAAIYYQKSDPYNANKREISKKLIECEYGIKALKTPGNYRIRNINQVNSKYHDIAPKITADLELMYFTSQRSREEQPENIYLSKANGGAWTPPINIGEPLNSPQINDACVGLSPDGQTMYIYKGINGGDIYESSLKGKKWSEPKPMPFNTIHRETSITISPDGNTLLFVRQLLDEKGVPNADSDIFQCRKNANGDWSKSVKLNTTINSEYDEESPYLHPDGVSLYFSSKGHSSIGGYDIFKSELINGYWSSPINLGYPLNTASDERNFVLSANGDYGLYAAEREGEGMGGFDIYFITMPPAKQPNLTLLKGKVIDESNGKGIEAKITITDNDLNEVVSEFYSNSESGEYLISLPSGKNYGISIEKTLHIFHSENIYLKPNSGYQVQINTVKLLNLNKGSTVILKNIFFATGSYQISSNSYPELEKLRQLMIENPNLSIQISGHTDNQGDENNNLQLSQNRANAVLNYLISKGIDVSRLKALGYGSKKPISTNDTEEGRSKNRRTEFVIL
jgi:outer membrane protein OmpA-like peptidoglycan-associated protein/tetratricopeptide (TPR) repeat protein